MDLTLQYLLTWIISFVWIVVYGFWEIANTSEGKNKDIRYYLLGLWGFVGTIGFLTYVWT
jgi:hypothetical protein